MKIKILIGFLIILLLLFAGSAIFWVTRRVTPKAMVLTTEGIMRTDTQEIVERVDRLILLPNNETPLVQKIVDKNKVANQPFFSQSEEGDWVIIFQKSQEAILYRPSTDKIVNYSADVTTQ